MRRDDVIAKLKEAEPALRERGTGGHDKKIRGSQKVAAP
jgi:hypothetical protein